MLMIKTRYRQSFIFILITAFLSLQWSSAHIHLADEHEHSGEQHEHSVTAHDHQLVSHHRDVIDSANMDIAADSIAHDNHKVIELEQLCTLYHGKNLDKSPILLSSIGTFFYQVYERKHSFTSVKTLSYNSYLETTSVRLRAPPYFS